MSGRLVAPMTRRPLARPTPSISFNNVDRTRPPTSSLDELSPPSPPPRAVTRASTFLLNGFIPWYTEEEEEDEEEEEEEEEKEEEEEEEEMLGGRRGRERGGEGRRKARNDGIGACGGKVERVFIHHLK